MKRKAIEVKYRKTSESFPEYLKYEITILNEDGTTEIIPAYGKDLQDALDRVVHDQKIEVIETKTKSIPIYFWMILWFAYLTVVASVFMKTENPFYIFGGIIVGGVIVVGVSNYMKKRNNSELIYKQK